MKTLINELINQKNVLILGFGREGKSTLKTLLEIGSAYSLTVADTRDITEELPDNVSSFCGSHYIDCLDNFDVVFKSPGIVLPKEIDEYKCQIVSQTEMFIRAYRNQVIGITGTKGKSTTSSLLFHALSSAGKKVLLAGNIGIPVFDIVPEIENDSIIVIELSCHQLEFAKTSPHRAVLLNIYEDHLDHYGTREKYAAAKKNIYLHQEKQDILYTTDETLAEIENCSSMINRVSLEDAPIGDFSKIPEIKLKGRHNLLNATFVYKICSEFGVTRDEFIDALKTFEPLAHRLSLAITKDGVDYYDDSISTTVKSAISAVESIENAKILLVGGMERNIDYTELVNYLVTSKLEFVVCMYESGKRFYDMYTKANADMLDAPKAILAGDLKEAVMFACELSREGWAVLLSPAAASYGYFKNFEERGEKFVEYVKNL